MDSQGSSQESVWTISWCDTYFLISLNLEISIYGFSQQILASLVWRKGYFYAKTALKSTQVLELHIQGLNLLI